MRLFYMFYNTTLCTYYTSTHVFLFNNRSTATQKVAVLINTLQSPVIIFTNRYASQDLLRLNREDSCFYTVDSELS